MEQNEDLIRLAGVVEELLASHAKLKQEKRELLQTVKDKEQHIQELQSSIARLKDEKADVSQRVSGILSVLEKWEKGQESEEEKSVQENNPGLFAEAAPSLFSMGG
jgi:septal ring factor EnvC (AmiA/AmiB activator)